MRLRRLCRVLVLAAAGGILFQATSTCTNQVLSTLSSDLIPALSSA